MQVASAFHDAGLEKYAVTTKVDGGTIRPAVPIEGALCDFPSCPNEYKYALELDKFAKTVTDVNPGPVREGFYGVAGVGGVEIFAPSVNSVMGPPTIFVCEDHKDYRPDIVAGQRFNEKYNPAKYQEKETHQVTKIPSFIVSEKKDVR